MSDFLYEILFRGSADGTISGQHVRRAKVYDLDGEIIERIGQAEAVTGVDVQAVLGELATAQAATIEAKDAEIAALKSTIEGAE